MSHFSAAFSTLLGWWWFIPEAEFRLHLNQQGYNKTIFFWRALDYFPFHCKLMFGLYDLNLYQHNFKPFYRFFFSQLCSVRESPSMSCYLFLYSCSFYKDKLVCINSFNFDISFGFNVPDIYCYSASPDHVRYFIVP